MAIIGDEQDYPPRTARKIHLARHRRRGVGLPPKHSSTPDSIRGLAGIPHRHPLAHYPDGR